MAKQDEPLECEKYLREFRRRRRAERARVRHLLGGVTAEETCSGTTYTIPAGRDRIDLSPGAPGWHRQAGVGMPPGVRWVRRRLGLE